MRLWIILTTAVLFLFSLPARFLSQDQGSGNAQVTSKQITPLSKLVQDTMDRNPEIQSARHAAEARRARIPQAGAWPDPRLSISYGGNAAPPFTVMSGDPSSARQIMAEQEIPYPGKTHLRTEIAAREANVVTLVGDAVSRRVVSEVKQAYFDLWFADRSLTILCKDRDLLSQFEKIAEIRYSTGKAAQQDVLKAQVELSRLIERQALLELSRQTLQAQLNSLRNLPADTPIVTPEDIKPDKVGISLDEFQSAAQEDNPSLKQQRAVVEGSRLAVDLAKKEVRPDFSVGYFYMQRDRMPDMYGITVSTSLPIFRHRKQDMAVAEAASSLAASRKTEESELTLLRYRIKKEFLEIQTSQQLLTLYSQGIIPQSSLTLESSISSYETGAVDLLNVLSNFTTVLEYELNYKQQIASYQKALARLEEYTALNLVQ